MNSIVSLQGDDLPRHTTSSKRKVYTLPLEKLRPSIRIAHRLKGGLNIPERIILDHELVLILSGDGDLRLKGQSIPFKAYDLLFIPPFARHSFLSRSAQVEHIAVHFDLAAQVPSFATKLVRRVPYEVRFSHGATLPRRKPLRAGDLILSWLKNIVTYFALGNPVARLRADALLINVLAGLFDHSQVPAANAIDSAQQARIGRALIHLENHLSERLVPSELARVADMSVSHFSRLFHRWTGLSPGEYLLRRRVEQARNLLGNLDLSIKEIAARCGFEDPYYFSRVFRQIDGLPPTHFRQALLAGRP